jgi:hypothetical protein
METELVPTATSVLDPEALSDFVDMVERRQQLKGSIKAMESEVKELDSALTNLMTDKGLPKCSIGTLMVSLVASSRSDLSKTKLIEAGVSVKVIEDCTIRREYSYLLVSETKVKGQDREG